MSKPIKKLTTALALGLMALPATADYIDVTWDDNGTVGNYLRSDANGYTFTIEEFSNDLRIEADLSGRKLRIDALSGLLDDGEPDAAIGPGIFDIISFDGDDAALIDHSEFQTEGVGDFLEIISIGGWNGSNDMFSSIVFNFQISENNDLLTGNGCIGASCGGSPVPVPAAAILFGTALLGLAGFKRSK